MDASDSGFVQDQLATIKLKEMRRNQAENEALNTFHLMQASQVSAADAAPLVPVPTAEVEVYSDSIQYDALQIALSTTASIRHPRMDTITKQCMSFMYLA